MLKLKLKGSIAISYLSVSLLILFQSCIAYKQPTSLESAARESIRTKIINQNGENLKYKRVQYEDGKYYGIKKVNGEEVTIEIDETKVETVKVKNKALSILLNILLAGGLAIFIPALIFAAGGGI